jgi:hypothetical protein
LNDQPDADPAQTPAQAVSAEQWLRICTNLTHDYKWLPDVLEAFAAHRTEALEEDCRNLRDAANGLAEHVERLQGQLLQAETHDYENCYVIDCGICKGIGKMAKRMVELWKGERTGREQAEEQLRQARGIKPMPLEWKCACSVCSGVKQQALLLQSRLEAAQKALTLVKTANDDDSWHDAMDAVDAALVPVSTQEGK